MRSCSFFSFNDSRKTTSWSVIFEFVPSQKVLTNRAREPLGPYRSSPWGIGLQKSLLGFPAVV